MIVDTHAHIYHGDEARYPMKDEPSRPEPGLGTIEHLRLEVEANGVERVVLVQTGSAYRWDNRLLADTARAHADWAVGVCTLDPEGEESPAELERLAAGYNVRGVRVEVASGRYHHEQAERLWRRAGEVGAVVCAHLQRGYLGELAALLDRFPQVQVVLDHCAYPKAAAGLADGAIVEAVALARYRQLNVKLSFAVTGSQEQFPFRDSHAQLRRVIDAFGPERCIWGSDFPCEHWLKKATYGQHLAVFADELGLSPGEKEQVLGGAATRLFFGD
jgi:predicted TIM-barrel fold metal-dependent hydrolase